MKISNLLILTASILGSSFASAAIPDQGGTVHFKGTIVNAACAISTESLDQIVNLGQYRTANFTTVGSLSNDVDFTIKLVDCDTDVSSTATVKFNGATDATDNTVLAVSSGTGTSGAATGVGIEISDAQGKILTPNNIVESNAYTLNNGDTVLSFRARYKSTSVDVTPGEANADATFVISYL